MALNSAAANENVETSAKRLLFSKPSWSKSQNFSNSDLFHRSEQIYVASAAELDRKRRVKKAKSELKGTLKEESAEPARKKQRIAEAEPPDQDEDDQDESSSDLDEDDHGDVGRSKPDSLANARYSPIAKTVNHMEHESLSQASACPETLNPTISYVNDEPKTSASPPTQLGQQGLSISTSIDLEDDEDDVKSSDPIVTKREILSPTVGYEADEISASDDEFPELTRKAREKARNRLIEERSSAQHTNLSSLALATNTRLPHPNPLPTTDPTLQILITSTIPNTAPLIVSRKLSQRLRDVRLAWADRQHFPGDLIQQVFLTWRGKRLFDVTTCKSLGVRVDSEGRVLVKDDVLGDEEGRIHMEAMTSEILEARRRAKTEEAEGHTDPSETDKQVEKTDNQIRIILKAKGFEDFKLKVKAVSALHSGFSRFGS